MHGCAMTAQVVFATKLLPTGITPERLQPIVFFVDVFLEVIFTGRG